jgi:hypothetical protein
VVGNVHNGHKKAVRLEGYGIKTDVTLIERRRLGAAGVGWCLMVALCSMVIGIWLL